MHHSLSDSLSDTHNINDPVSLSWQEQLKTTVNNIKDLCAAVHLDYDILSTQYLNLNPNFPVRVPKFYLDKITKNNPNDPLLLQVLPTTAETIHQVGYCQDPLKETELYLKAPGLIHKYYNRVLLTLTGACGIHCRFCFRQYFPYSENILSTKHRGLQLDYIKNHPEINEIILSGGDPLCVSNSYLELLLKDLSSVDHIQTIRFHSRMPIVIPDRIDSDFINILKKYNHFKFVLVTHCNHPQELDNYIKFKISLLREHNVTVLNQTVLLKNINSTSNVLIKLSNKLFECHILPYYLHLLDPVSGTGHFNVDIESAQLILREVNSKLSGYLVPKLVKEISNHPNKSMVFY